MHGRVKILFLAGLIVGGVPSDPADAQPMNPNHGARVGRSQAGDSGDESAARAGRLEERLAQRRNGGRLRGRGAVGALPEELRERIAVRAGEYLRNTTGSGMWGIGDRWSDATRPRPFGPAPSSAPSLTLDGQLHLAAGADIFQGSMPFLWSDGTLGANTGLGYLANVNTYGSFNTAGGFYAGSYSAKYTTSFGAWAGHFSLGYGSTRIGYGAGLISAGFADTAVGALSQRNSLSLGGNTTSGAYSQYNVGGLLNTSTGFRSLYQSSELSGLGDTAPDPRIPPGGSYNTALGAYALTAPEPTDSPGVTVTIPPFYGSHNVAVGFEAGANLAAGSFGSHNIHINNPGIPGDQGTIRIGSFYNLATPAGAPGGTRIYGIFQPPVPPPTYPYYPVCIGIENKLFPCFGGVPNGAAKLDVGDTGSLRERLQALRPVSYGSDTEDPSEMGVRLGLLAEEVAEVLPELVKFTPDGEPGRVDYKLLASLLLSELQHQAKELDRQTSLNASQQAELETLRVLRAELAELRELEARLIRLEAAAEDPRHALASTGN